MVVLCLIGISCCEAAEKKDEGQDGWKAGAMRETRELPEQGSFDGQHAMG